MAKVLEPESLGPFSQTELRSEIDRCLSGLGANDLDLFVDSLLKHPRPLPFLDFVRRRIQDRDAAEQAFKERLSRWEDAFNALDKDVAVADANKLHQRIVCWYRALELDGS